MSWRKIFNSESEKEIFELYFLMVSLAPVAIVRFLP
jgi:hypothetical protein